MHLLNSDGIVISSNLAGVVRTWDILTGCCKAPFHTLAYQSIWRYVQLIDGRLIFAWYADGKLYTWDTDKGGLLQTMDALCDQ